MPSGENRVVDEQVRLLRERGIEVELYACNSDDIEHMSLGQKAAMATRPIYSFEDAKRLKERFAAFRPDVVLVHNVLPLLSPAVVRVATRAGIPVVQVVHNYRHACAAGVFFRDGAICEDCTQHSVPWPAVVHKCYRESTMQSAVVATSQFANRRAWQKATRFLAVSEFVASKLATTGIPAEHVRIVPNAVVDPGEASAPGHGFVFVGRLTAEKGVALLLDAWRESGVGAREKLVIVGDGTQRAIVEEAAAHDASIDYRGRVEPHEVGAILEAAAVVVVPSMCYEGFPLLVAEAFARGRPVLASDLGALHDIVDDTVGWRAAPVAADFASALRAIDRAGAEARSPVARRRFVESYSLDAVIDQLIRNLEEVAGAAG